ncbi:MAG: RSP_7527 family protein [Rhodoferax sp.]
MEYSYIEIEAHIRQAQKLRSEAMGEILCVGWSSFKQLLSRLAYRQPQKSAGLVNR